LNNIVPLPPVNFINVTSSKQDDEFDNDHQNQEDHLYVIQMFSSSHDQELQSL